MFAIVAYDPYDTCIDDLNLWFWMKWEDKIEGQPREYWRRGGLGVCFCPFLLGGVFG